MMLFSLILMAAMVAPSPGARLSKIARRQEPGSVAIRLMHPGAGPPEGGRRRYADGATPILRANKWLKLPGLEKPTARHASVTDRPPPSRRRARSRRTPMRN